jgi:ubiquinone/menaquinone biosynthesis C-methylase UbiE
MIARLFRTLCHVSPRLRRWLWKRWYQLIARFYRRKDWGFMNYGYASVGGTEELDLGEADEDDRYCIQLYHHVASAVDLTGLDVLEVGCGRGGGADFVKRHLKPRTMVGVDFSKNAVTFSSRNFAADGLAFVVGDAESLPFDDASFDAVTNVESSHCYGSMDAFLGQVRRVLRPGGRFLYADFYSQPELDVVRGQLDRSGLDLVSETDITANVVEALDRDHDRKAARVKQCVHKPLVRPFLEFAGAKGSAIHRKFSDRTYTYLSFVLQKPAAPPA